MAQLTPFQYCTYCSISLKPRDAQCKVTSTEMYRCTIQRAESGIDGCLHRIYLLQQTYYQTPIIVRSSICSSMLKCEMLGASDTPSERLEDRRHDYSGNCANASVYDYLCQYLYDEKRERTGHISTYVQQTRQEAHTHHQHHNASPYRRPLAHHLHEPQT